jgi:hypothetical protein
MQLLHRESKTTVSLKNAELLTRHPTLKTIFEIFTPAFHQQLYPGVEWAPATGTDSQSSFEGILIRLSKEGEEKHGACQISNS